MTFEDSRKVARAMREVGWPGKERQISFFQEHQSCVGFVAKNRGEIVGAAFGCRNGAVGWLGLIFVRAEFRRGGIGRALTEAVADSLEERGCRTLLLVATAEGASLYEKLGFADETLYHGFAGPGSDAPPDMDFHPLTPDNLSAVKLLDGHILDEDRSCLLESCSSGWVLPGESEEARAYHLVAPWGGVPGGGPALASDFEAGTKVVDLRRSLAGVTGSVRVWLADENTRGREYMKSIGFEEFRVSPRMIRGESLDWEPEGLWGVFSLAKG